jgi:putative transposase
MPRPLRLDIADFPYHVMNRAYSRWTLFQSETEFSHFETLLMQTAITYSMRVLAYCLMTNHWHLVLWPREDGALSRFMQRLTMTHSQQLHATRGTSGNGHIYQGRYKSVPIQTDDHLATACRYVERNPLRANLVNRAELWRWSSLKDPRPTWLEDWNATPCDSWIDIVNEPQTTEEEKAVSGAMKKNRPFGTPAFVRETAKRYHLEQTLRNPGRPRA